MSSGHETPAVPGGQPNPVMVGPGMKTLADGAYADASHVTPAVDADKQTHANPGAFSYFDHTPAAHGAMPSDGDADASSPATPEQAAKHSHSGKELLRRLSLVGVSPQEIPETDPRELYPGLRLSGRIISAAFCMPYKLYFKSGSDWVWLPYFLLGLRYFAPLLVMCALGCDAMDLKADF